MEFRFVPFLIAVVVGVLLCATMLFPIISEATATDRTFDNSQYAYYDMKALEEGDSWAYAAGTWTYNDQPITINNVGGDKISIVASNNEVVRQDGQARGTSYNGSNTDDVEAITVEGVDYLNINDNNVAYTSGYGAVPDGDYVLKKYDAAGYVKKDTPLWVTGFTNLTTSSNSQLIVHIEGTIDDGLTITVTPKAYAPVTGITVGDYTINYESASEGVGLYKLTSVVFDVTGTFNEEEITTTFTYSTFVIPKEITAEKSQHLNDTEQTLVGIIPLLVIIGLVIGVLAIFARRAEIF